MRSLALTIGALCHVLFGKIKTARSNLSPNQRLALLLYLGFLVVVVGSVGYNVYDEHEQQRAFDAMTPARHLQEAKSSFGAELYGLALRHARAITSGPEVSEARKIEQKASTAQEAEREAIARRRQAAEAVEQDRRTAVRDLQSDLKNLGYDLTVSQSDKPNELIITSKDFDDTEHRVRFLAFLRGRNSPTAGVCVSGFQKVRLKERDSFFGFNDVYSLECFNR
jgi:uncharacterized FlaG/YvyC family protein